MGGLIFTSYPYEVVIRVTCQSLTKWNLYKKSFQWNIDIGSASRRSDKSMLGLVAWMLKEPSRKEELRPGTVGIHHNRRCQEVQHTTKTDIKRSIYMHRFPGMYRRVVHKAPSTSHVV